MEHHASKEDLCLFLQEYGGIMYNHFKRWEHFALWDGQLSNLGLRFASNGKSLNIPQKTDIMKAIYLLKSMAL